MTTAIEQPSVAALAPATAQPGERYVGIAFQNGAPSHHLFLLDAKPDGRLTWTAAKEWAAELGATLPTRFESALLYANLRDQFDTAWHWTDTQSSGSTAWIQTFSYGDQDYGAKFNKFLARAVRRLPLLSIAFGVPA